MIRKNDNTPAKIHALRAGFRPVFHYSNFDDYLAKLGFSIDEIAEYSFFMDYLRKLNNEKQKNIDLSAGFDPDRLRFKFI